MILRSNVPDFAERILAVCPIQRTERTELIPPGIQLPPFLIIRIFGPCLVPYFLTGYIAVLYTEATDVHGPIRNTAHREVQSGRDLSLHVFPTGSDVTAPGSRRITLQAGKARAGQQEHTFVIVYSPLSVINGLRIHQGISIEEFGRRAQCGRATQSLAVIDVGTIANVRFTGIHPPGVDTQYIQFVLHLFPEEFAGIGTIGIVEGPDVTRTYPVADAILDSLLVHPTVLVELLVMLGRSIELRPNRNHEPAIHGMDRIYHSFRVRETGLVEVVASPCIFGPIAPVLYDIIYRNLPVTELFQGTDKFSRSLVTLPALPVSHRPLRHDRRLSGQCTVSADYFIHIIACYEIIVQLFGHLAPPGLLALLFGSHRSQHPQSGIRYITIRFPFYFQRNPFACFQVDGEFIAVRIPGCTPSFRHYQFTVNVNLRIAGIVKDELEFAALRRFDTSFICHLRTHERETFRKIDHFR